MKLNKIFFEKIHTLIWFLKRPKFWLHAIELIKRIFLSNLDTISHKEIARKWASEHSVSYEEALLKMGIDGNKQGMSKAILKEGQDLADKSLANMGGPGDTNLLYDIVRLTKSKLVIETGVAYGWSSLSILYAMSQNNEGKLYSVDMPYPKMDNESFVGIVIPERFKKRWSLIREPDRNGLKKAIKKIGYKIDFCHYDSDKSWWGRAYAFPILWRALNLGGLFISDDIQDNLYFAEFAKAKSMPYAVIKSGNKYVGIIRKIKNDC